MERFGYMFKGFPPFHSIIKRAVPGRHFRTAVILFLIVFAGPGLDIQTGAAAPRLSFTLDAPTFRELEARMIVNQLRGVGIDVRVSIWKKVDLQKEIKTGSRTAYLTDWGSSFFDPFDLAYPKLKTDGRGNFSFFSNPQVDELLNLAGGTNNTKIRRQAYFQVQNLIYHQAPFIFGYILPNMEATSVTVTNFRPSLDNRINLHDVGLSSGDTLVVGMRAASFQSLDPATYRGRETETMLRNLFDGLVTRTQDGTVIPELAESWQQTDDTTYIFTIRKDVTFHNGLPMTVHDVVYTFERILNPYALEGMASPRRNLLGPLLKVEAVDEERVRFILQTPFPSFLQALVHFQIVPRDYLQTVGGGVFAKSPIGAGPFKFVGGKLDQEIVMERYDGYYGGSPDLPPVGPARIKRAIFRLIPSDTLSIMALLSGEAQIIQSVPLEYTSMLYQDPQVLVHVVEGTRSYQVELNTSVPPFNDIRLRKAVNYAVDWENILKIVYGGFGHRLATCFLPSGFGYNPNLKPYPFDPEKSKILLEEAGYANSPMQQSKDDTEQQAVK